jgi:hypothetical protein
MANSFSCKLLIILVYKNKILRRGVSVKVLSLEAIGAGTEIKGIRESFIPHKNPYN